ncbi:hypothetical protein [uncultured Winogradskyella sp.]|uniref:hypothetical protein n=1 Tax=uncultured Winogradskyella sp. TaxID=395353 RepID=UPI00261F6D09|nr:hypothetical protein [uncultured Winogradskyella sp.]
MKKITSLLLIALTLVACKNETKPEVNLEDNRAKSYDANDGFITMKGEYLYYADAAVFQTPTEIYGVVMDENLKRLNEQAKPLKKEATDGVMLTARVKKIKKNEDEEGWPYKLEIKEILKLEATDPKKEDVIKLGN